MSAAGKIRILSTALSNKIAAGEVVERPSSVVKELVENAIDANAKRIEIVIRDSGKELVQVIDDGDGMSAEDLEVSFERHATSKIMTAADLTRIESLGFRGEALPSIASVSQIEAASAEEQNGIGAMLRLEAGRVTDRKKTATAKGTNIRVKHLFYNTPARRNFMRSNSAELQHILTVLKRFFLAYPEIHYVVYSDDTELFNLAGGDIEDRMKQVFGEEHFVRLVRIHETLGGIELAGFLSRPDNVRRTRGNQFLFLNGRPIQDKSLSHAIFQGYSNSISPGEYPTYCLFLEMDPKLVDVNVHPTKMEVRFSNDRSLYYFFLSSIRKVLGDERVIPKMSSGGDQPFLARFSGQEPAEPQDLATEFRHRKKYLSRDQGNQLSLVYFKQDMPQDDPAGKDETIPDVPEQDVSVQFWQIHRRYILSEIKSGLVVIDQHVAHERILFEKILRMLREQKQAAGQHLLFPQTITLAMDDFMVFKEILHLLQKIGFGIRVFSGTTVVIDTIPVDVKIGRESQVIMDIVDYYKVTEDRQFDAFEKMAAAFACKNAIKSGESLNQTQMHAIVDQLFACEAPYFCPHGRPVVVTLDLDEFDRKFKRVK